MRNFSFPPKKDLFREQRENNILAFYPLHNKSEQEWLWRHWGKAWTTLQSTDVYSFGEDLPPTAPPKEEMKKLDGTYQRYRVIDAVRDYFGENLALYFGFIGFYTRWVAFASILGVLALIVAFVDSITCKIFHFFFFEFLFLWITVLQHSSRILTLGPLQFMQSSLQFGRHGFSSSGRGRTLLSILSGTCLNTVLRNKFQSCGFHVQHLTNNLKKFEKKTLRSPDQTSVDHHDQVFGTEESSWSWTQRI